MGEGEGKGLGMWKTTGVGRGAGEGAGGRHQLHLTPSRGRRVTRQQQHNRQEAEKQRMQCFSWAVNGEYMPAAHQLLP